MTETKKFVVLTQKSDILQEEVNYLRQRLSELEVSRKIEGTPLALDLTKFGFSPRYVNLLHKKGCNNLADLLKLDAPTLIDDHKLGRSIVKKIERTLEDIGLRLGMNLNCMSDEDFNNLVSMLANLTGYTTLDFNADVEPLKSETVYSLEKRLFQMGKSLESLKRKLNDANDVISKREETIRIQREEIKSFRKEIRTLRKAEEDKIKVSDKLKSVEADFQKFKDRQHSQEQKQNAIFEHKEATMKTWIKGLEEDLASKREHIRSLELAQKELQEENEKLKEQCTRGDSSQ